MNAPAFNPLAYRFHPSSIGRLMSDAPAMDVTVLSPDELAIWRKKSRNEEEQALMEECRGRCLSEGAKEYVRDIAKGFLYGAWKILDTRELEKGRQLEADAIELYNTLNFTSYTKNTERRVSDLLTGECDVYDPGVLTLDTKVAWNLDTFPVLAAQAHNSMYEWQGRAYMKLWDVPVHKVAFLLLSTPDDLIPRNDQIELHKVDHIDPKLRCTVIEYQRDLALEKKMDAKLRTAQKFLAEAVALIRAEHGIAADWRKKFLKPGA